MRGGMVCMVGRGRDGVIRWWACSSVARRRSQGGWNSVWALGARGLRFAAGACYASRTASASRHVCRGRIVLRALSAAPRQIVAG